MTHRLHPSAPVAALTSSASATITLEHVSYSLADGTVLFADLTEQFDTRRTGLVGRNGAGKSVLAAILAGQLPPSSGRCTRSGAVYYLPQQITPAAGATVADLAGLRTPLDALARIAAGSVDQQDFDAVGERWDLPQQLQQALARIGLGRFDAATAASALSGGELMRVALAGAMLSGADFLILDEPNNHLDRANRQALIAQLQQWSGGLIVISHDRQLLDGMARIVELSAAGLRSYGGSYALYAECKAHERDSASARLAQRKHERHRADQAIAAQQERQQRRAARGQRQGSEANQAKILLGRQKQRSESSAGKLRQQHAAIRSELDEQVRSARQAVHDEAAIVMHALPAPAAPGRRLAELDDVTLPHVTGATRRINLLLTGAQRVGVIGANGCGKSTLLKLLAGQLAPLAGHCRRADGVVYLDQQLALLAPDRSAIEQLLAANRTTPAATLRTMLAQLGLDARKVSAPSGALSGGERLKAALACVLYADPPPQLLLLDEPSNHLDLPSLQALETMLHHYRGALVVVSHDDAFLAALGLTHRLTADAAGWWLSTW